VTDPNGWGRAGGGGGASVVGVESRKSCADESKTTAEQRQYAKDAGALWVSESETKASNSESLRKHLVFDSESRRKVTKEVFIATWRLAVRTEKSTISYNSLKNSDE
jgi:hypothetical protein